MAVTSSAARQIKSDPDVCGFPGQMLGAYLAGLVAAGDASRVTLHRPVSGGDEVSVEAGAAEATVRVGSEVVATVENGDPADIVVPPFVPPSEVDGVAVVDPEHHPVPGCYVCGPRPPGPGLRLDFRVPAGRALVCARWRPTEPVPDPLAWAALDCPGFWALLHDVPTGTHVVSRTLHGAVHQPVQAGRDHVIVGAPLGQRGRGVRVTAALFDADGGLCAVVEQTLVTTTWGFPLAALGAEHSANRGGS